ncbi:ferredoxin reductase family protein [Gymnodinialimonas sp.]
MTFASAGHETAPNLAALLAGTIAFSLMTANVVLATRLRVLEQWIGGLDRVYEVHKWTGALVLGLIVAHTQIGFEQIEGVLPPGSLSETAVEVGELALYPFIALLLLSLIKRIPKVPFEIPYNIWRWSHRLIGVIFMMLAFHQLFVKVPFGPSDLISQWMIAMAAVGLLALIWTWIQNPLRTRGFTVSEVEQLPGATRVLATPTGRGLRVKPGQFAFFAAKKSGLREPHPFTVSGTGEGGTIEFSIRPLGDFTRRLRDKLAVGDKLSIQGGYGTFRPQDARMPQLWVAGGIGITPFLAAAEALAPDMEGEITLIHAVPSQSAAVGADRLRDVERRVPGFSYHLHASDTASRLTGAIVLDHLPFDLSQADMWFCGPAPLRKALQSQFKAAGKSPRRIHFERFEFR